MEPRAYRSLPGKCYHEPQYSPQSSLSRRLILDDRYNNPNGRSESLFGNRQVVEKWSVGLFATFIHTFGLGGEVSFASSSTSEVEYSCESMETSRFTPSSAYITKAAVEDEAVKAHLKIGGRGAKAFLITGVKTVQGVTITTTEGTKRDTKVQVGVDIPASQLTVGPKFTYNPSTSQVHTTTIAGPIVFAFEVEKLCVNRKGMATHKEYIDGAMLGKKAEIEYVVERAGDALNEDELEDFGMRTIPGFEEETQMDCQIVVPIIELRTKKQTIVIECYGTGC